MLAVRDSFAIEATDDRQSYDEERVNLIGTSEGVLLHVTYRARWTHSHHLGQAGGKLCC